MGRGVRLGKMYDNVPERFIPDTVKPELIYAHPKLHYIHNNDDLNATYELLERGIEENAWGEETCIESLDTEETITYEELQGRVNQFAGALAELGIESGDRVLWRFGDVPEAYITQLAIWKIGAVNVPSAMPESARELAYYLNDTEAVAVVTIDDMFEEVEKALDETGHVRDVIVLGENDHGYHSFSDLLENEHVKSDPAPTAPFDVASIFYTGGTTGKPKGSIHSHAAEVAMADIEGGEGRGLGPDDVVFCPAPIGHAMGNGDKICFPLRFGSKTVLSQRPSAPRMLEIVEEEEVTVFDALGTMIRMMLTEADVTTYDLSTIRLLITPIIDNELYERWMGLTDIEMNNSLGMSPMRSYFLVPYRDGEKFAPDVSLGRPNSGYEAKVVDVEDPTEEIERGEVGTLIVRGPTGIAYWNNIHPEMPEKMEEDSYNGWSIMDDAYYQTEDGFLYHVARLDDMIESSGRQISAREVEEVVSGHESVNEVAVVGKSHEVRGQIVKAFVELTPDADPDERLKVDIQDYAKANMAKYKYPREVEFIDEIPIDAQGKIQRKQLRDRDA